MNTTNTNGKATTMSARRARAQSAKSIALARQYLAAITAKVEEMDASVQAIPDDGVPNWGRVGSLGKAVEDLRELAVFLGVEDEGAR